VRIESTACERLGLTLPRADGAAAAEPDESWLEGLDEALVDLPEPQQEAIRLRVIEELGYGHDAGDRRRGGCCREPPDQHEVGGAQPPGGHGGPDRHRPHV